MNKPLLFVCFIGTVLITALATRYFVHKADLLIYTQVDLSSQAMLAFNHQDSYADIEKSLESGCKERALAIAKSEKELQLSLLADYFKKYPNTWVNKYVTDRDPNLITALKTFSVNKQDWTIPECNQ